VEAEFLIKKKVDEQFLRDIAITAIEGGTGYWASVSEYRADVAANEIIVVIHFYEGEDDGDDQQTRKLTLMDIAEGIKRVLNPEFRVGDQIKGCLIQSICSNDAGMADADVADVIVQAALFGEIVYG